MSKISILQFLNNLKYIRRYSIHTIIAYKGDLNHFQKFCEGKILSTNSKDIRNWIIYLKCKGYCERSINRKIFTLRSFFKYHYKRGNINSNVCYGISKLRYLKKTSFYLNEEKVIEIFERFEHRDNRKRIRDKLILELLYYTGCRLDEIINLKKNEIDFNRKVIKVTGKGKKERLVPINNRIIELIVIHIKKWKCKNKGALLLNDNRGQKLYPMFIWRLIRKHFSQEEIQNSVSAHNLRHSTATHLYNHGAPLKYIQELLGHSYLSSTLIYIHVEPDIIKQIHKSCHPKEV